jgi:hypothetical protein
VAFKEAATEGDYAASFVRLAAILVGVTGFSGWLRLAGRAIG